MNFQRRCRIRKGFTLIELLIVIFIVSLVYFLGFRGVELGSQKPKALTPLNLKSIITKSELFTGQATLLCINKCRQCYLRRDVSSPFQAYEHGIDLQGIKVYTLDSRDDLLEIEYGRYDDEKICLQMDFYENGSSAQLILANEEGAYFLPAYFAEAKRFDTPEEAREHWVQHNNVLSNQGDFY